MKKLGWSFRRFRNRCIRQAFLPRQECDELIVIFVTIINRAKDKLLLPFAFSLLPSRGWRVVRGLEPRATLTRPTRFPLQSGP